MAGHGEKLMAARKTILGKKWKWGAMVDDQRRELVHWARNNLTDHGVHSIYRDPRWWRPIWGRHASGRREGEVTGASYRGSHWLMSYGGHYWVLTANNNVVKGSRCGTTEWTAVATATAAQPRHQQVSTATGWPQCPKLIHSEDLLPRVVIRVLPSTNCSTGLNPGAGVTGGEVQCTWRSFCYCTIGNSFSASDRVS
jgi:hypothetical protein